MSRSLIRFGTFAVIFIFLMNVFPAFGQTDDKDRANTDEKYKWNLADIYPSDEAWQQDKEKLKERFNKISEFKGQLSLSGSKLKEALETKIRIVSPIDLLFVNAKLLVLDFPTLLFPPWLSYS